MAQIVIRDLSDELVAHLKKKAAENRRSLEAEIASILESATRKNMSEARAAADAIRRRLKGRPSTDSVELLRRDRYE